MTNLFLKNCAEEHLNARIRAERVRQVHVQVRPTLKAASASLFKMIPYQ